MEKFNKLLMKKKKEGKELSGPEKDAKMSVVQAMRDFAQGEMGKKLDGLKKVSVSSNTKEGITSGLDKAKELVGHMPEGLHDDGENDMEEAAETPIDEMEHEISGSGEDEYENCTEEQINSKLAKLMSLKQKMQK